MSHLRDFVLVAVPQVAEQSDDGPQLPQPPFAVRRKNVKIDILRIVKAREFWLKLKQKYRYTCFVLINYALKGSYNIYCYIVIMFMSLLLHVSMLQSSWALSLIPDCPLIITHIAPGVPQTLSRDFVPLLQDTEHFVHEDHCNHTPNSKD